VARRIDRLRALADKIAGETGRKVEVIAADLVKRKDLAKAEAVLRPTSGLPPSSTMPASVRRLRFSRPT
jgi:hypothetical protein